MIINLDQILKNDEGKDFTDEFGKPKEHSLKDMLRLSLNAHIKGEETLAANEKFERFLLAKKLLKGGKMDLKIDDIKKIKDCVGKLFPVQMLGAIFEALEGNDPE